MKLNFRAEHTKTKNVYYVNFHSLWTTLLVKGKNGFINDIRKKHTMLTLTSAAILSIANPSTVSCDEETKTMHQYIIQNQNGFGTVFPILIYFTVLFILSLFSSLLVYCTCFTLMSLDMRKPPW